MLTFDQFNTLTQPVVDLYEEFIQSIIADIARRIIKMGVPTATAAWQAKRIVESGAVFEDVLDKLSKLSNTSEALLKVQFEKAGVRAMRFDDAIYRAAGLDPLPLNLSPQMLDVLIDGWNRTKGEMFNLTQTTAFQSQQAFIRALDVAHLQVTSGAMSYGQAVKQAVVSVADEGVLVSYPSGHTDQLDVAMRRSVLSGMGQVTGNLQKTRAEEMGQDLVQTSAHIGARPTHEVWQGKIFSLSGNSEKYPEFVSGTGYGTGAGLGGWNCRHSFYPYFRGISKNAYDQATLDFQKNVKVTHEGEEIPIYDALQKQRYIERTIRHYKRRARALEAAGLDNSREIAKVREWQARMRGFIKETGLNRDGSREGGRALKFAPESP